MTNTEDAPSTGLEFKWGGFAQSNYVVDCSCDESFESMTGYMKHYWFTHTIEGRATAKIITSVKRVTECLK